VTELSLYDIVHAPGVAIDLNHIDTPSKVTGFLPDNDGLKKALAGADIVVISAGKKSSSPSSREFAEILFRYCTKTRNDSRW
jgi:malate/lactate dehydrogenase